MGKTKIEWTNYTKNPIKGICKTGCPWCYAIRMYKRFKWNPEIRFAPEVLDEIKGIKKPSKIFLCSTHEIFGKWIPNKWRKEIYKTIKNNPDHIFQLLTKQPQNIPYYDFGKNVWIGVTITNEKEKKKIDYIRKVKCGVRFVSFEPLLDNIYPDLKDIDWIIIGKLTGSKKIKLEKEWVLDIMREARARHIPIFIKNNIKWEKTIQNFPKKE